MSESLLGARAQRGWSLASAGKGEGIAAQADSRVFAEGRWNFTGHDDLRTLHHVAGGHFIVDGEAVDARPLPPEQP